MRSSVTATHTRQVFMAHICSGCGFPMLTVVQIKAYDTESYAFMESVAAEKAGSKADDAIKYEINRIKSCKNTKKPLTEKEKRSFFDDSARSSISGFASSCPYCGCIEPWKISDAPTGVIEKLSDENFPVVFVNADDADWWAEENVIKISGHIEKKRKDKEVIDQAIEGVLVKAREIVILEEKLKSIPELKVREDLLKRLEECKRSKDKIGLLDFRRRKDICDKIKILELKFEDIKKIIEQKEIPIKKMILKGKNELRYIQAKAFGCKKDITKVTHNNAVCYIFEPDDIPLYLTEHIKEAKDSKTSQQVDNLCVDEKNDCENNEQILFCRKCGFKLLPDSIFCTKCGFKLIEGR